MANSGERVDLSQIADNIVDKHSTGGVGDKATLILMPIIASLGLPVAKISSRGLGISGGTIDKLESIPGYDSEISLEEFKENVQRVGVSIIHQSFNLAPAESKERAVDSFLSTGQTIGMSSSRVGFVVPKGRPRYVKGRDPTVQPKICARAEACCKPRFMGINVDFWKLIFRPTESA